MFSPAPGYIVSSHSRWVVIDALIPVGFIFWISQTGYPNNVLNNRAGTAEPPDRPTRGGTAQSELWYLSLWCRRQCEWSTSSAVTVPAESIVPSVSPGGPLGSKTFIGLAALGN